MACFSRSQLTRTLAEVLDVAGDHLPPELQDRARRMLDLHGSLEALEQACGAARDRVVLCDI